MFRASRVCGYSPTYKLGSATNLALNAAHSGDFAKARDYLDFVLKSAGQATYVKLAALDNLALVELCQGRTQTCRALLAQCQSTASADKVPARSWNDLANDVTRCAYFEAIGDWTEVVAVADAADPELARRQFKAMRTSLLCAKARALARLGKHAGADAALADRRPLLPARRRRSAHRPRSLQGALLSLRGDAAKGAVHYDRAIAACRAIGHRYHEWWIDRDRRDIAQYAANRPSHVDRPSRDMTDTRHCC